uniref:Calcineurin B-like protein 3 n=1 Tax=Rhizophora mucronata TaxID=61149 RepID=A0A2P2K321_RHIMU
MAKPCFTTSFPFKEYDSSVSQRHHHHIPQFCVSLTS